MEWLILLLVIVVIGAVIWQRRNRTSRGGADSLAAAHTDSPPAPSASPGQTGSAAAAAPAPAAPVAAAVPAAAPDTAGELRPEAGRAEATEWETQWSETLPPDPHAPGAAGHSDHTARGVHVPDELPAQSAPAGRPVHHPEYTGTHAPTLPGAESAAAESGDGADLEDATVAGVVGTADPGTTGAQGAAAEAVPAATSLTSTSLTTGTAVPPAVAAEVPGLPPAETGTPQAATPAPAPGTSAGPGPELSGHLALEQPYGEGSAAPAVDGTGPEDFTVKADASSMTYYEETSPGYEEARAEVWFLSPAHAEAAGFRPPRRARR